MATLDVKCPQCGTEYELERNRVVAEGLPVKCSQCQHVFTVYPEGGGPAWKVRQANGNVFEFRELTTLQRWIVEQKVSRDDHISKTGRNWKRLGDIAELASFFQVVDKAKRRATDPSSLPAAFPGGGPQQAVAQRLHQPSPSVPPPAPNEATGWNLDDLDPPTAAAFVIGGGGITSNEELPLPAAPSPRAPTRRPRSAPVPHPHLVDELDGDWDDEEPLRSGGRGKWIALGLLSLIAAAVTVYLLRPDLLTQLMGPQVPQLAASHLSTGYRELNRDTEAAIAAAIDNFEKSIALAPAYAPAKAALAEALLTRAENKVAMAALLLADSSGAKSAAGEPGADEAVASERAKSLREEAERDAERAFTVAKEALVVNPSGLAANRALADYYRFKRAKTQMASLLERAKQQAPRDARLAYVMGSSYLEDKTSAATAALHFEQALQAEPNLLRARYKLALAQRLQDQTGLAIAQLEKVLEQEPEHQRAQLLLKKLKPPAPPPPQEEKAEEVTDEKAPPPMSAERLVAQGDRLRQRDQARSAMRMYERALEQEPENIDAINGLAWCYFDLEETDAAIATFKRVLRLVPRFTDAHMGIATAYEEKGMKRDAIKHYRKYLDILPNGPESAVARQALQRLQ